MEFSLAELRETGKKDLGVSSWMEIDQKRIDGFAEATEDRQWIHVDVERARESEFGTTIAHGYLLVSIVPKLFAEMFSVPEAKMLVNYGLDKIRFIQPVTSGSVVRLECRIVSVSERGGSLLMRVRGELVLQAEDGSAGRKCVLLDTLFMVVPPDDPQA